MSKKTIRFYNELNEEETRDIPHLPSLMAAKKQKKTVSKTLSEQNPPEKVSGGEDIPYLPEIRKAGSEHKSLKLVSPSTGNEEPPDSTDKDKETALKASQEKIGQVIEETGKNSHEQHNPLDGRRFYFELSADEKEDIVFLPDHFKKTNKPYDPAARLTGRVIAFRKAKKPVHSVFPVYKAQQAAMTVAACLMIAIGGKAIFNGVDNISKMFVPPLRGPANENRMISPSYIIKDLKNKEIPITKAVRSRNP